MHIPSNAILSARLEYEHYDKYEKLVQLIGVDNLLIFVPHMCNQSYLQEMYNKDKHLNSIPLKYWDSKSDYIKDFYHCKGLSLAELVCILKHVARYHILKISAPTAHLMNELLCSECE